MKIGDKVRVLADNGKPTFPEMLGEIVGVYLIGHYYVQFEGERKYIFREDELELIEKRSSAMATVFGRLYGKNKMTKEEILAIGVGGVLDALVAVEVLGVHYVEGQEGNNYSTNISAAWEVVEKMRTELYSVRRRFLDALQSQTEHKVSGTEELMTVAWSDVFWYVNSATICRAALLAKLER